MAGHHHKEVLNGVEAEVNGSLWFECTTHHKDLERDGSSMEDGLQLSPPQEYMPPAKRGKRQKKTVPKVREMEESCVASDSNMEGAAFSSEPGVSRMQEYSGCETPQSGYEEEDEEEEDMHDFRRFSSRMRKQTNFFGVRDEPYATTRASRGFRRSRSRGPPARRMLQFDSPTADLLMIKPKPIQKVSLQEDVYTQPKQLSTTTQKEDQREDKQTGRGDDVPARMPQEEVERLFPIGTLIWGKLLGYDWWSGYVISYDDGGGTAKRDKETDGGEEEEGMGSSLPQVWIKWFGDNQLSQIPIDRLARFEEFKDYFKPLHMKGIYKRAVIAALKEAAKRCKKEFVSQPDDKKLRWIVTESCPIPKPIDEKGDKSIEEKRVDQERTEINTNVVKPVSDETDKETVLVKLEPATEVTDNHVDSGSGHKGRGKREKGTILLTMMEQEMIDWAMKGFLPAGPEGLKPTQEHQVSVQVVPVGGDMGGASMRIGHLNEGEEPPRKRLKMMIQIRSKARFESVRDGKVKISELCIGCADMAVAAEHPLFEGGLCKECKESFMECAYLFDEDGTQMYCTICSGGDEVFMCDAENCAKVYCGPCIEKLCGSNELERVRAADQWLCYMCSPELNSIGLLTKREDWVHKLKELFLNDREMEYDPPPFYPPIPPEERRPIKVLGLFDGIATGLLVLKELGIEVATYVSSEIDMDAVYVSRVQHKEIVHVGDIEKITEKEIEAWGPFDLIMGGSPCNDLSIVNPARKGIYEGTGRLFFEFFRILSYAKPAANEDRPFFWLFENVVSMRAHDKATISRFLHCNPVVVDAREISAAHRARYFWGNLPGMNRPTIPLPGDRLTLQDCLEPNCFRQAQFTKLRTITTKMNSIKQTKKAIYPVKIEGQADDEGDVLWCTEMERLFGFPDHYTDVANLGRCGRQRLLGKAWSVPVIRHLLSPLKDYFKSSTTMEQVTNGNP